MKISMVDLPKEYQLLQEELDKAINNVLQSGHFIGGSQVNELASNLSTYLQVNHVVPCANGTDALQIALMSLGLSPGDEVIIPAFTYVAPAEAALLLGLKPVFVDVHPKTFNIDINQIEQAISLKTKAIIPVHLFGQAVDMQALMQLAKQHQLYVIEDCAQAFGTVTNFNNQYQKVGTIGDIGCTSFFPSKNLGCYGDGGAIYTNNEGLATACKQIASHGQSGRKFFHDAVGVNSRLDTLQAAILSVKLIHLDQYLSNRKQLASTYHQAFASIPEITIPAAIYDHTFHQYVIQVPQRDQLQSHLQSKGISCGVYYPFTIPELPPYHTKQEFLVATSLTKTILALPIHPHLSREEQEYIIQTIIDYYG